MRQITQVLATIFSLLFIVFLYTSGTSVSTPDAVASPVEDPAEKLPQIIKSVRLDKVYSFAGEPLPSENFDALERLDRELLVNSYYHSSTILNLKNASRFFPVIEVILAEEGVPADFKYVAVIESNLRNATSPAGAKGLWQFMKVSGKGYGLEISAEVDERYHVEKATRAACALIKDYKKRFGTWSNAAGAYNMGETRFAAEMKRQKMDSYYDMNFGAETGRYLFRILAMKEIMQSPQHYGFYVENEGLYRPLTDCNMHTVDKTITDLGLFAVDNGTTYRMLKLYNPWLITSRLTVATGKSYDLKIPQ
ncbi:MAG: lytic transglycosylase domain-containing protein [Saprospiraceae bacterium]|nr:lytic transglycosylase domain-containing protein [Saprospiraceae bacterium]